MIRKPQQIRNEIYNEAIAYGRGGDDWHLGRIKELVAELDFHESFQSRYIISKHAVTQFMARSKCKDEQQAKGNILSLLSNSEQMEVIERYRAIQLINHDFKDAEYFKSGQWLVVVSGNVIVTCHKASAKRWKKLERTNNEQQNLSY